jgi:arylsulfatase A-like enzyme
VPANTVSDALIITMDWTRTFLDAAGVAPDPQHPMDGMSLMPLLREPVTGRFDRPLFWRLKYRDQHAMRDGHWKYLRIEGREYLFNLAVDERERANRASEEPQRLSAMRAAYDAWNAGMPPVPEDAEYDLPIDEDDMPGAHLR